MSPSDERTAGNWHNVYRPSPDEVTGGRIVEESLFSSAVNLMARLIEPAYEPDV